jgi:hypothetical protein
VVVPGRGTDAQAGRLLVLQVEFAQQVQALGDEVTAAELAVALVVHRVRQDAWVLLFHAHAEVAAHGGVQAQLEIGVAGVDLEGRGGLHGGQAGQQRCQRGESQRAVLARYTGGQSHGSCLRSCRGQVERAASRQGSGLSARGRDR